MMKCLTLVVNSCMYMSDGTCQPGPEGRATQSGPHLAAAVRSWARGRPTLGSDLLHLPPSSVSLPRAGPIFEGRGSGRGPQGCLYGQAFSPPRATAPEVCPRDRVDLKR